MIANGIWSKFLDPEHGCPRMNRRYRLRTFPDSYTSAGIVDWLKNNGHVSSRSVQFPLSLADLQTSAAQSQLSGPQMDRLLIFGMFLLCTKWKLVKSFLSKPQSQKL